MVKVGVRKLALTEVQSAFGLSQSKGCKLLSLARSVAQHQSRREDPVQLMKRLQALAVERPRFGYRRLHTLLVRVGWRLNRKRVQRLYRLLNLLDRVIEKRGKPHRILMDNGPEFTSLLLEAWAYQQGIELHFITPGKLS